VRNIIIVTALGLFLAQCRSDTVKDIDGNTYTTTRIGSQIWMAENLKTTRYSNGDTIKTTPLPTTDIEIEIMPQYQWAYDGDEQNVATYGRLYTWFVAADARNVCPDGWHVPTDAEWSELTDYLINSDYGFGNGYMRMDVAKSLSSDSSWIYDETPGSPGNEQPAKKITKFNAIPAGCRLEDGNFHKAGYYANWWTSTEGGASFGQILTGTVVKGKGGILRVIYNNYQYVNSYINNKKYGSSIRCLKNSAHVILEETKN
jgi:uncharacterized protein (TIGR02145 family)